MVSSALLCGALTAVPLLNRLTLAVPLHSHRDAGNGLAMVPERGLASLLSPQLSQQQRLGLGSAAGGVRSTNASSSPTPPVALLEARRTDVLPPLTLRQARVEDHDDMATVMQRAAQRYVCGVLCSSAGESACRRFTVRRCLQSRIWAAQRQVAEWAFSAVYEGH
jgi:hypothetical protein